MSDSRATPEINYEHIQQLEPHYKFTKLTPREGSGNVTITTAGGQESHFDIPQRAYNLSKSILSFAVAPPAIAANYNYMQMDALTMVRQIQLYSRQGTYLCDVNHVGNVTKIMWKPETSVEKFMALENHDNGTGAGSMLQKCNTDIGEFSSFTSAEVIAAGRAAGVNTVGGAVATGILTFAAGGGAATFNCQTELRVGDNIVFTGGTQIQRNLIITSITSATTCVVAGLSADLAATALTTATFSVYRKAGGLTNTNARRHDDALLITGAGAASSVSVPVVEAKYFSVGGLNSATPAISVKFDMGLLYNTIFSLDKTLLFDEILTLRIVWAPSTKIYYYGDDQLSPGGGTLAAAAGDVTLSGLQLYLAVEQRQDIINGLRQKIQSSGLSVLIPYVHVYKTTLSGGSQNVTLRFDRGHGMRLVKLYHSLFSNTESKNTAYDHDNRAGAKVTSYYTTLDSQRIQDFNVAPASFEDYLIHQDKLKGSAILNSDVYQYNWFHCDDWSGTKPLYVKEQNKVAGLDLSVERRWEFVGTVVNAFYQHHSVAVVQKMLKITRDSIELM